MNVHVEWQLYTFLQDTKQLDHIQQSRNSKEKFFVKSHNSNTVQTKVLKR